jgi:hypothetical protein
MQRSSHQRFLRQGLLLEIATIDFEELVGPVAVLC